LILEKTIDKNERFKGSKFLFKDLKSKPGIKL
jgi:hypothetical protein